VCAPTVNAYKRLQPDMMNGYWANWGHDDRTVAVRISPDRGPSTRLENRVPDGACNPYLAAAALLHACRFGVEDELELQEPQPLGADPVAPIHVPDNLAEAVDLLEHDDRLVEALGAPLVEAFATLKRAEWERYLAATPDPTTTELTTWELEYYTPFF
jgi:glutamine synthetase